MNHKSHDKSQRFCTLVQVLEYNVLSTLYSSRPIVDTILILKPITMYRILVLFLLLIASSASAFIVQPPAAVRNAAIVRVGAHQNNNRFIEQATAAAIAIAASPLVALAEEVDDYEYGAVDAPIGT